MQEDRPINLNLLALRFPVTAIASILHRVSGILIFLFIPFYLYLLEQSTLTEKTFNEIAHCMQSHCGKSFIWLTLTVVSYHILAGIRHLLMDIGFFEELKSAKQSVYVLFFLVLVDSVLTGVWLW